MAIQFQVAAQAAQAGEEEKIVEVPIEGITYQARKLTTAQAALIPIALTGPSVVDRLGAALQMIEMLIGSAGAAHVRRLIIARRIDMGDIIGGSEQNPDGGLLDQILREFSQHPSQPSADSSSSRPNGGRKSTGRSPGKGSTHSDSTSTDS